MKISALCSDVSNSFTWGSSPLVIVHGKPRCIMVTRTSFDTSVGYIQLAHLKLLNWSFQPAIQLIFYLKWKVIFILAATVEICIGSLSLYHIYSQKNRYTTHIHITKFGHIKSYDVFSTREKQQLATHTILCYLCMPQEIQSVVRLHSEYYCRCESLYFGPLDWCHQRRKLLLRLRIQTFKTRTLYSSTDMFWWSTCGFQPWTYA